MASSLQKKKQAYLAGPYQNQQPIKRPMMTQFRQHVGSAQQSSLSMKRADSQKNIRKPQMMHTQGTQQSSWWPAAATTQVTINSMQKTMSSFNSKTTMLQYLQIQQSGLARGKLLQKAKQRAQSLKRNQSTASLTRQKSSTKMTTLDQLKHAQGLEDEPTQPSSSMPYSMSINNLKIPLKTMSKPMTAQEGVRRLANLDSVRDLLRKSSRERIPIKSTLMSTFKPLSLQTHGQEIRRKDVHVESIGATPIVTNIPVKIEDQADTSMDQTCADILDMLND